MPSAYGSMVKWTSSLASNEVFQVRVLVGLLTNGRATRLATGPGWKPVEPQGLEGSTPSPSAGEESPCVGRGLIGGVSGYGPGRGMRKKTKHSPWVCRTARQLAKLLDQVRFLDGLLSTLWGETLTCDRGV